MNYYMAFGGTNYGRHVGGPNIITSYDYDVQVNEYVYPAEPKYSLLAGLHSVLQANKDLLLGQDIPKTLTSGANYCEQHNYEGKEGKGCLMFLSNWDTSNKCSFAINNHAKTIEVSPWSVSILKGDSCDSVSYLYSTRDSAATIKANKLSTAGKVEIPLEAGYCEAIPPSSVDANIPVVTSTYPLEQLSVTNDTSDYLWYSTVLPAASNDKNSTLAFTIANGGGGLVTLYLNNKKVSTFDPNNSIKSKLSSTKISFLLSLDQTQENKLSVLTSTMGLQNYGANLEEVTAGIVSNITLDGQVITGWSHSVGLTGEISKFAENTKKVMSQASSDSCEAIRWFKASLPMKNLFKDSKSSLSLPLALDMISGGLKKGSVWVNGFMLGRYWNINAQGACTECTSSSYTGAYNADRCRTGCGSPSQQYYKVPRDILHSEHRYSSLSFDYWFLIIFIFSGLENVLVITDETGELDATAKPTVNLVQMVMV